MNLGAPELVVILLLGLLLFGPKKLPELGRSLGEGLREFKKSTREIRSDLERSFDEPAADNKVRKERPAEGEA